MDLEQVQRELHAARHLDDQLADWARFWGPRLIEEVRRMRAIVHHSSEAEHASENDDGRA